MSIPRDVVERTERRAPGDLKSLRESMRGRKPAEVNPPERLTEYMTRSGTDRAMFEGDGALERILGNSNDLLGVNYLERGMNAARSVGRINICDASGDVIGYGTGFLVAPRLLLTNNHVFPDKPTARQSFVEFNFQLDVTGKQGVTQSFGIDVDACFTTSAALDYTLVAVRETNDANAKLSQYGFLRLSATPGKTLDANFLTIIQHPSGGLKQIALRENQLIKTTDGFLWYATDTAPGSSGSCVYNDAWQVVALHHSGVPEKDANGNWLAVDGSIWTSAMGDDKVKWIANEGVRISSICLDLRAYAKTNADVRALLKSAGVALESDGAPITESTFVRASADASSEARRASAVSAQEKISIDPNYDNRHGYDPAFLGTGGKRVPLPKLSTEQMSLVPAKNVDDGHQPHVLPYHHYSVVMNGQRRLAFFTAVNIDGNLSMRPRREADNWFYDPRIARESQVGNELYANNDLDRGHLVRRLDPAWGETNRVVKTANDDTFHWTNCSPQHKNFNQGQNLWAGLEDYILENTDANDMKVTVFSGPIFGNDDREHPATGVLIPNDYWKVVVMRKSDGALSATGYVVTQKQLIANMQLEEFTFGAHRTFQLPIRRIAESTKLNFGKLPDYDPLAGDAATEAAAPVARLINAYRDIKL